MKTKFLIPVVAAGVIASGLFIARAQTSDRQDGPFGRGHIMARIARRLQLTSDQRTQIKAILVAEKEPLVSDFSRWHESRVQLRAAIQSSGASEASVRTASANVAAVEADLAVERLKLHNQISPLLTAEQKEKLGEMEDNADTFVDGVIDRIGAGLSK
jgi:Spy/CpxP family protein refolding chaperone